MLMVSGQIPHIWGKFWYQIKVKCPTFPLYSLGGRGVVGHNIDGCIKRENKVFSILSLPDLGRPAKGSMGK